MAYSGGFDYGANGGNPGGNTFGGFGGAEPMGAFGGGEAGGFMGASQGASPAGKSKNKDRQTLLPLTIRQLKSATQEHQDDSWKVDGAELHQVKIVGNILKVEETSTFTKYDIEDSTGVVEVKMWLDQSDDDTMTERRSACREGVYVRAIGIVRSFQGMMHIVSHDVRPVVDHNEITHHFLEAIYQHCQHTKPKPQAAAPGAWGSQLPMPQQSISAGGGDQGHSGFTAAQSRVLNFFVQNDSHDDDGMGLSLDVVATSLAGEGIHEKDVRAAVDFLANEGHLYSTIDDNHYKSTA